MPVLVIFNKVENWWRKSLYQIYLEKLCIIFIKKKKTLPYADVLPYVLTCKFYLGGPEDKVKVETVMFLKENIFDLRSGKYSLKINKNNF